MYVFIYIFIYLFKDVCVFFVFLGRLPSLRNWRKPKLEWRTCCGRRFVLKEAAPASHALWAELDTLGICWIAGPIHGHVQMQHSELPWHGPMVVTACIWGVHACSYTHSSGCGDLGALHFLAQLVKPTEIGPWVSHVQVEGGGGIELSEWSGKTSSDINDMESRFQRQWFRDEDPSAPCMSISRWTRAFWAAALLNYWITLLSPQEVLLLELTRYKEELGRQDSPDTQNYGLPNRYVAWLMLIRWVRLLLRLSRGFPLGLLIFILEFISFLDVIENL